MKWDKTWPERKHKMDDFSIISNISIGVVRLLRENLCPETMQSPESIRLSSPADKNADFQLGVFLYDIRELTEYRSSEQVRSRNNMKTYPPKPLTLHYMLFMNSKAQIVAGAEVEQRVFGRALQVLYDNAIMDVSEQQPFAEERGSVGITILNLNYEDKNKIWSSMMMPYQLGIFFTVSPAILLSRRTETFTRVTEAQYETRLWDGDTSKTGKGNPNG